MKPTRFLIVFLLLGTAVRLPSQSINVTSAGVGIGTATPAQTLDVAGSVVASGNVGIGIAPTSNRLEVNGVTKNTGEVISILTGFAQFRAVGGSYGCFIRNDGSDTYVLLTSAGDQYGGWNSLRPLRINNATGNVFVNGLLVNPPYVTRIQVTGSVDDDLAISVGGIPFVHTGTSFADVNYDIQFNVDTCLWYAYTNNRNNGNRGDGWRAGVGYMFAGSERLTFTPINTGGASGSNLTYVITYSDGTIVSKNISGWHGAQLCNKILYKTNNDNTPEANFRNRVEL